MTGESTVELYRMVRLIRRFQAAAGPLAGVERDRIDREVDTLLADAVTFALESPYPDPVGALDDLYASGLRPRQGSGV